MRTLSWCYVSVMVMLTAPLVLISQDLQRVMPGHINVDKADTVLRPSTVESAMALAFESSGKFVYLPIYTRDSVLKSSNNSEQTIASAAKAVGANAIAFAKVSRLVNLVRAEIILSSGEEYKQQATGIGYAAITYADSKSNAPVADPAILSALQHSLAKTVENPDLYSEADEAIRTKPTMLIAVGGIEFRSDSADPKPWNLFKEKTVASFDLVQTIVYALQHHDAYTIIDIETRDSMYAMAGFRMVENDRPPSYTEVKTLRRFEVQRMVTGTLEREGEGARLTLYECILGSDNNYTPVGSASVVIGEDTKAAFRSGIQQCVADLFKASAK